MRAARQVRRAHTGFFAFCLDADGTLNCSRKPGAHGVSVELERDHVRLYCTHTVHRQASLYPVYPCTVHCAITLA